MKRVLIILTFILCFTFGSVKAETVTFNKCIDGDTASLKINGQTKNVRFLAIDTPETNHPTKGEEPYGTEAKEYTCFILQNAKKITLEYEKDKTDKYDRVLAWVFADGELLQGKLVKEGLAKVAYLYDDYKYTDELQSFEKIAKKNKLNIWSNYKPDNTKYIYLAIVIVITIVVCIFDKSYRKRTVSKVKRKAKSELNKRVNKLLK